MTAMDGGNAIFAGAKICPWHRVIPFILNIPWFLLHAKPGYRPSLDVKKPSLGGKKSTHRI